MTATTKTVKATNYTTEQAAQMVADYVANPSQLTVEKIAETLGKSVRSVVAKLSREKVYKAKVYATKTGEAVVKKDELADKVGAIVGGTESEIESLTKINKTMLKKLLDALNNFEASDSGITESEFEAREKAQREEAAKTWDHEAEDNEYFHPNMK